ncbi:lysophospholipid acyltransferase family protein [Ferrovibrio xuzhouensis]|uniref:Lysophospholipid acyltransferase family protein n=1 Tax=Ferrovibrio xuzhouensis TaxID=1576914 RepID=A0ABV7VD81_9PROT
MMMLRSLVFQVVFLGFSTLLALYSLIPLMRGDRDQVFAINALWSRCINRLLRWIVGIDFRVEGREHIPDGPVLIAAKHQSLWDTTIIFHLFARPAVVMKQELQRIPIYGWLTRAQGMIAVDRDGGARALKQMLKDARVAVAEGRKLVIFPQGTRTLPGEVLPYQSGVAALYRDLKLPVVPAAVNSGFFWPKYGLRRRPGTIVLRYLPAIPPGLDREEFMHELETRIETATAQLEAETRAKLS